MEWRRRERHDYGMRIAHAKPRQEPRRGSGQVRGRRVVLGRLTRDGQPYRWTVLSIQRRRSASAPRFPSGLGETAPALAGRRRALGLR